MTDMNIEIVKLRKPLLPVSIFKEEGEPYYNDTYDHSKPLKEKLYDIVEYTKASMDTNTDLGYCLDTIAELPKSWVRKRAKLLLEAEDLLGKLWRYNANIRRINRGIDIIEDKND